MRNLDRQFEAQDLQTVVEIQYKEYSENVVLRTQNDAVELLELIKNDNDILKVVTVVEGCIKLEETFETTIKKTKKALNEAVKMDANAWKYDALEEVNMELKDTIYEVAKALFKKGKLSYDYCDCILNSDWCFCRDFLEEYECENEL